MPVVKEGEMTQVTKCSVTYQEEECSHISLSSTSLVCPRKVTNKSRGIF